MLAFKIDVDGESVALAGIPDWSVMGVHVAATRGGLRPGEDVDLHIGGLSHPDALGVAEHVRWAGRRLRIGSKITVSVVDTDQPDPPLKRYRSQKESPGKSVHREELKELRRQDYLELKREFEGTSG